MVSNEKTFFSFLWVLLEKFGFSGLSFISTLLLARLLTPYEFGLIGTITIFISLSNMVVESGFGAALVQKKNITNNDYSTIFVFNAIMSVFLYIILFISAPFIADYYNNDIFTSIIRVLGVILIINAVTLTQKVHLIRELAFKQQAAINLAALIISILCALTLAYLGYGVWALVAQLVLYSFFVSLFMWFKVRFIPSLIFNTQSFKELFSFGGRIILTSALQTIYNDIFGLVITKKFSVSLTGLYTQANKLVSFPTSIFSSLYDSVAFPVLSKIDNPEEFKTMYSNINNGIFSLALPLLLIIPFQVENIILTVLGTNWTEAAPILKILSISLLTSLISLSSFSVFKAKGLGETMLRYGIIKIVIGLIILVISIQISFEAIIYGVVITNFIFSLLVFHKVSKITLYKWKELFKDYFLLIFSFLVLNFLVKYLLNLFEIEGALIQLISYLFLMLVMTIGYFAIFKRYVIRKVLLIIRQRSK